MSRCTKIRYPKKLDAKLALASTHRARSSTREESRIYWHEKCHAYHLTSRTDGRER